MYRKSKDNIIKTLREKSPKRPLEAEEPKRIEKKKKQRGLQAGTKKLH